MKALFIHDHRFYKIENSDLIYSPGGLPSKTWERYLEHFDSLTVVGRGKLIGEYKDGLVISSKEEVGFELFYNVAGGLDYYKFKNSIKKKLREQILEHDVIVIRLPSTIGSFAAEICIKENKKYIVEVVGCAWDSNWNYGSILTKCIAPFNFYNTKKLVKKSIGAIYVTEKFLQDRYPSKAITGYASNVQIEKTDFSVLEAHQSLLSETKNNLKFGMIGNLSIKYKGYDVLFKALNLLNKNFINYKLYLVGGGNSGYVESLIQKYSLQDNVIIVGRLESGKAIFDFLDTLDLYIHPSKQEGLPRAVIEAMSRACPVLASSVAGTPELIASDFLHKPGDFKMLYSQLSNIIHDKNELIAMSKMNYNKAMEYYIDNLKIRRSIFFSQVKKNLK